MYYILQLDPSLKAEGISACIHYKIEHPIGGTASQILCFIDPLATVLTTRTCMEYWILGKETCLKNF